MKKLHIFIFCSCILLLTSSGCSKETSESSKQIEESQIQSSSEMQQTTTTAITENDTVVQEQMKAPWEEPGAKQPDEYTFEDYNKLDYEWRIPFENTFHSKGEFDKWLTDTQGNEKDEKKAPWNEKGAKQPNEYTLEEYYKLDIEWRIPFEKWFGSTAKFDEWMNKAIYGEEIPKTTPWDEAGAKKPDKYTWKEYEALPSNLKEAFFMWFDSAEEYDEWMTKAKGNEAPQKKAPWEKQGAKKPDKYTWDEFNRLDAEWLMPFQNWFGSIEKFDEWMAKAQGNEEAPKEAPWEKQGAKKPDKYTWDEFNRLDEELIIPFQNWFGSIEKFEKWMVEAQSDAETQKKAPWEKQGAKKPDEYTWDEFNQLDAEWIIPFQNWFNSSEEFEKWMIEAQADAETQKKAPWENQGAKKPNEYTWEEFNQLDAKWTIPFQNWFNSSEEFEKWMIEAQGNEESPKKAPWEKQGAKKPDEYTWDEFNQLDAEWTIAFQNWFNSTEEFEEWMIEVQSEDFAK